MANELTLSVSLRYAKGSRKPVKAGKSGVQLDVSGSDYYEATQSIGTSAEALGIGDITTPGYMYVHNLDATNFVEIRHGASGDDVVKVRAGGIALFELTTTTPFAIADTAAVEIEYTIIEA